MKESPCERCGNMCRHTDDDLRPLCDHCTEVEAAVRLITDIAEGRQRAPDTEPHE